MTNNKKIYYFFLILPFLDLLTSIIVRNYNILLTPGIIIKILFLAFLTIYIFITNSKYKKISIILLLLIFFYLICYFLFKPNILNTNYIFNELHYLLKLVYFPITFIGLLCFFDENNFNKDIIKKIFFSSLIIYFFLLIIPIITNTAYPTYPKDWQGYIGWFYAGNEIANIMILLLPIAYTLLDKSKTSFIAIFPIYLITFTIGTKVATFCSIIISFIFLLFYLLKKEYRKALSSFLIVLFACLLLPNSYAIQNYKFAYNQVEPIEIEEVNIEEVNKINNQLNKFYDKNQITKIFKNLLNGRDMLLANTLSIYNKNKDNSNIFFGIGFSNTDKINNHNISRLIEIDVLDGNYHYGLIGLIIMFSPFIISGYIIIINRKKLNLNILLITTIIFLLLGISTFSGHVLISPAVCLYLVLYLLLLLNEFNAFQRKNKSNKIAILSLHLGYGGIEKSVVNQANMLVLENNVEIVSLYKVIDNIPYEINPKVRIIYLSNLKPNKEEFMNAYHHKKIFKITKEGIKSLYILYKKRTLTIKYLYNSNAKIIISTRLYFTSLLNNYSDTQTIKIAEEHTYHHNNPKYLKKLIKSLKNIDYIIPSSKYISKDYENLLSNEKVKVKYLPQIIDYIPNNVNKCTNMNIISVGRLSKEKGFDDLIEIMKLVKDKNNSIKLTLVGDGELYNNLQEKINTYNLDNIIMKGFLNSADLKKEYKKVSLYIMTSKEESFGLVLIEAMSYGIPCFAFDSALGAQEIITNECGKLINNRDIKKMAEEIIDYFKQKEHQVLSENARKRALEYSFDKCAPLWNNFIKELK